LAERDVVGSAFRQTDEKAVRLKPDATRDTNTETETV